MDELSKYAQDNWRIQWSMDSNLKHQVITAEGTLSVKNVESVARHVFPYLEDMVGRQPQWSQGIDGLHQLIFLAFMQGATKRRIPGY